MGAGQVYFSKRVFSEPLRNRELGLPAFLAMLFQRFAGKRKSSRFSRPWFGIVIVVPAALLYLGF